MQRSISQDHNLYNSDEFVDPFDVTSIFGLISKHGGERLRVFGLECGVKLLLKHADTGTSVRPKSDSSQSRHGGMSISVPYQADGQSTPAKQLTH